METWSILYKQTYQFPSASPPPPVLADLDHHFRRRVHHHQNVYNQTIFIMPLRGLNLRRITANQNHIRFNHPTEAVAITNHLTSIKMAEELKNKDSVQGKVDPTTLNVYKGKEENGKASEKSTPAIPPPPEKPLPGDCCGSGCVRCVWDVYYDELEEYNRIYKADSNIS